jgi:hypothetical protein
MPLKLFSSPYVQTYKRTDRWTASRTLRYIFLFLYWGETPAELRPLYGPLTVSWMVDKQYRASATLLMSENPLFPQQVPNGLTLD